MELPFFWQQMSSPGHHCLPSTLGLTHGSPQHRTTFGQSQRFYWISFPSAAWVEDNSNNRSPQIQTTTHVNYLWSRTEPRRQRADWERGGRTCGRAGGRSGLADVNCWTENGYTTRSYCTAQGTVFNILGEIIMEKSIFFKKNVYVKLNHLAAQQ